MDPLSIIASAFTLLSAIGVGVEGLRRLHSLHNAPAHLDLLIHELEAFFQLLSMVQVAVSSLDPHSYDPIFAYVETTFQRATEAVGRLNDLIETHLTRTDDASGSTVLRKRGFLKRERLQRILLELSAARIELITALVILNTCQLQYLPRIHLAVQRLSVSEESCPDESNDLKSPILTKESAWPSHQTLSVSKDRQSLVALSSSATFPTPLYRSCSIYCPCQCHNNAAGETPAWLRILFGQLFYKFNGVPLLSQRSCNWTCHNQGKASANFVYKFPDWLSSWVFTASTSWTVLDGTNGTWNLKVPEILDERAFAMVHYYSHDTTAFVKYLDVNRVSVSSVDPISGGTMLQKAALRRYSETCRILAQRGADWHSHNGYSFGSAAQIAWRAILENKSNLTELKKVLEEFEVELDFQFNLLHHIVTGSIAGDLAEQVKLHPKMINEVDYLGRTALVWAVIRDDLPAAKILLDLKADPNIVDKEQKVALHHAESVPMAQALRRAGALTELPNFDLSQESPLELHIYQRNKPVVWYLLQSGADPNFPQDYPPIVNTMYCGTDRVELLEMLLDHNADINARVNGTTAVMKAVTLNHVRLVRILMDRGASLDSGSAYKNIIKCAAEGSGVQIMRMLTKDNIPDIVLLPSDHAEYWDIFEKKNWRYQGDWREPIEQVRAAFNDLLWSVTACSITEVRQDVHQGALGRVVELDTTESAVSEESVFAYESLLWS